MGIPGTEVCDAVQHKYCVTEQSIRTGTTDTLYWCTLDIPRIKTVIIDDNVRQWEHTLTAGPFQPCEVRAT